MNKASFGRTLLISTSLFLFSCEMGPSAQDDAPEYQASDFELMDAGSSGMGGGVVAPMNQAQGSSEFLNNQRDREMARRQEARLTAVKATEEGDEALRIGDAETAIFKYREAMLIMRYFPMVATPDLNADILRGKLEQAVRDKASGAFKNKVRLEGEARAERMAQEQADLEYMADKIANLLREADYAFLNGKFKESETYLDQILAIDPIHAEAKELREIVIASRHQATNRINQQKFREEWQKTLEEMQGMDIPQTETIEFDLKRWAQVSKRKPMEFSGPEAQSAPEIQAIEARLNQTRFAPKFDEAPLEEVAQFLQHLTGVNFLLSTAVQDMDPDSKKITLDLADTSVRKLLDILADVYPVKYRVKHGLVQIITPEEMSGGQYLRFYEVRDIISPIPNFPAPEINLVGSGGIEESDEEPPEPEAPIVDDSTLIELIRNNVDTESWDADPRNTINIQQGTLIVSQTGEVHEKINKLLGDLREATGIMVDIQARFLTVADNFLQDVGVDFRGLGNDAAAGVGGKGTSQPFDDFGNNLPNVIGNGNDSGAFYDFQGDSDVRSRVENLYDLTLGKQDVLSPSGGLSLQWTFLDNVELEAILRAVEKSERINIVQAPRLLVYNTQRASLQVRNKVSYIRDFDVQIAQAATIADPIVDWIHSGVFLDVTPVVSADRRFITLELRPTVANLKRPIETFPTNLATGSPVNIQLPELEIQRVRTTVSIPDGGTLLLAGATTIEEQDYVSGVPILKDIPLVGFFFSRKGRFQEKKKLLILLRTSIIIPKEHEPRLVTGRR